MPTVTATADLICQTSGLSTTSTERAIVIAALNHVYKRAVRTAGCYKKALTAAALTAGTAAYTLGTSPFTDTDVARVRYLYATSGGQARRLEEISEADLLLLQESSGSGDVSFYCVQYPSIQFWPTPGSGVTINGSYEAYPKTLVESNPAAGEESTPTAFPAEFHDSILYHGGCAVANEYRGNPGGKQDYHWTQYAQGVSELIDFVNQVGGVDGPSIVGISPIPGSWGEY